MGEWLGPGMCKLVLFESVIDARTELNLLSQQIKKHFTPEDLIPIKDLQKFVLKKEDGWVLDKNLHTLVAKILSDANPEFVAMKGRSLMNYASADLESLTLNEQKALVLLFCNLFSTTQSRRWLMYFSQWTTDGGVLTSNAQITCDLARSAMNNLNPQIQLYASGIVFNMSARDFGASQSLDVIIEPLCPEEQPMRTVELGNEDGICHLKAHDALFLQICLSTYDIIMRKSKSLQENIIWNYLQTLEKLLPNVRSDFLLLKPDAHVDLGDIAGLSNRNETQLESVRKVLNCQISN